ncbi:MAG: PorV/PorQ family protein [Candidatus Eisenbacteria bacterium]|nr:PorV/PorQ family protein [Candidatus Eisenbacteria bacterium]
MLKESLVVLLLTALVVAPAAAQVSIGGAQSLYIAPGARPAGMGDAFVSIAGDATACWWNPAGLAFMDSEYNVSLLHSQLVPDWEDVYYEYAAYAQKVEGLGTIGGSLIYLTYGEQYATREDSPEVVGKFRSYEVIPSAAYGASIGDHIGIGINVKWIYVSLAPAAYTIEGIEGSGTSFAADMGVLWRLMDGRWNVGAAVQNVGPRIGYIDEEQSDPLPRNLKVGTSYMLASDEMNQLTVAADYNKSLVLVEKIADQTLGVILNAGAEYLYYDLFALRAGYVYDEDGEIKGFSFGMGLKYQNFSFDVATVPQAEGLTRPFRFSMTASF